MTTDSEDEASYNNEEEHSEGGQTSGPGNNATGDDGNPYGGDMENILPVSGMYEEWFLDYASYVILERAVPLMDDGLKPVQRRILHAMKTMDDGRFNKVANIIGESMKYHPHGDASIGEALVQLGQKGLLIETQGNWGNIITGDTAAAPRYIEARLSKFAHDVVFNDKITDWQLSYDGRNKEPIALPVKFPLLLAQGVEGIAVGLACKVLPHNFNEIIDGAVRILRGKNAELYPDFPTGGLADFSQYNDGKRGGRVRLRARIEKEDNKTLLITEIPYGTTTSSLIDSIIRANEKGKIKVRHVEDNTSEHAEIRIHLPSGTSPDKTIDALFAFSDCELSISPNATVIQENKPRFLGVSELLRESVEHTVALLKQELSVKKSELEEKWHFASLEKIFIEHRIYRDIEDCETWESVLGTIDAGLKPHVQKLKRAITRDDLIYLTEIRIKRISRYDSYKADERIRELENGIADLEHKLDHLTDHAIAYFKDLKKKYGKGRERKTEIRTFDTIEATKVTIANKKLYVDRQDGFIGWGMKKAEYVCDCADIDNIIVFREDGTMLVTPVESKKFVGKGICHAGVWKRGDKRTIYHMVYRDGKNGPVRAKRFYVDAVKRDKNYDLTRGNKGSKLLYITSNPNGRREVIRVVLQQQKRLKKGKFDVDLSDIPIRSRGAQGNILSKKAVQRIEQLEVGESTLGGRKIWYDDAVNRLNVDERGTYLGEFSGEDKILTITQDGDYKLNDYALSTHFDDNIVQIEKWEPDRPVSAVYYDGEKGVYRVKRFYPEQTQKKTRFITEHSKSFLEIVSTAHEPRVRVTFDKKDKPEADILLSEVVGIKGVKAKGNKLTDGGINRVDPIDPLPEEENDDQEGGDDETLSSEENMGPSGVRETETDIKPEERSEEPDNEEKKKGDKKGDDPGEEGQMTLF